MAQRAVVLHRAHRPDRGREAPLRRRRRRRADDGSKTAAAAQDAGHGGAENVEEYLSLESHSNKARRMESAQSTKFKRSFTLPARMSSSTTSTSPSVSASTAPAPPQQQQGMEYRGPHEGGVYSDLMETFLE